MSKFRLALAQYPITRHSNMSEWKAHVKNWVKSAVNDKSQILVFPEYGSLEICGFFSSVVLSNLQDQLNEMNKYINEFQDLYAQLAKQENIYILAPSFPVRVDSYFVNRAFFFHPSGEFSYQDKLLMTRFEDEDWRISPGAPHLRVFDTEFGKIGINICFDSEFPQFAFELAQAGVELLLAPSCTETVWGLSRVHTGCRARALENQFIVANSSTVGDATWCQAVDYNTGQAGVFGPADFGFPDDGIIQLGELNKSQWLVADIDLNKVQAVRTQGAVFNYKKSDVYMKQNPQLRIETIKF